jgi:hypothetical protein
MDANLRLSVFNSKKAYPQELADGVFCTAYIPLVPREGHILFALGQKVCKNPTAAPGAMEGCAEAWWVIAAPAEAEEKVNVDLVVWP